MGMVLVTDETSFYRCSAMYLSHSLFVCVFSGKETSISRLEPNAMVKDLSWEY
jgi:hypothetical protein